MDSASGVAIVFKLARVFASYRAKASIAFAAFAGEEEGLLGANNLAQTYKNVSVNVAAMLNMDTLGKLLFLFIVPTILLLLRRRAR